MPANGNGQEGDSPWDAVFGHPLWRGMVRYSDLDAVGLVNYSRYLQYADDIVYAWWCGLSLPFQPRVTDFGLVTAAANMAWLRQIDDRYELEGSLGVCNIGRTSFEVYVAIRRKADSDPCFVARLVQVYWRGRPTAIPENLRDQLRSHVWEPQFATWIEASLSRRTKAADDSAVESDSNASIERKDTEQ